MARPRTIWWRTGEKCYFTTIDGKKVRLCKDLDDSRRKLARIIGGEPAAVEEGVRLAQVAERFLGHSRATNAAETADVHEMFLAGFMRHVGPKLVTALVEADLDAWIEGMKTWNENTAVRARAVVLACLNFGVRKLGLPPHPLKHVRAGSCDRRERILTDEERAKVRGAVAGPFADFVRALELTGARPFSEVAKVTAADCDLVAGTWTLQKHKNRRKKKVARVIYLVPEMVELTRRLMKSRPAGPLFGNRSGRPWTRQALTARFRALGKRLGIAGLMAYTFRHQFVTDALARGVPAAVVAELCGTSIQTIEKHYRHLDTKQDVLREAARKALGGSTESRD
jgi:integrase